MIELVSNAVLNSTSHHWRLFFIGRAAWRWKIKKIKIKCRKLSRFQLFSFSHTLNFNSVSRFAISILNWSRRKSRVALHLFCQIRSNKTATSNDLNVMFTRVKAWNAIRRVKSFSFCKQLESDFDANPIQFCVLIRGETLLLLSRRAMINFHRKDERKRSFQQRKAVLMKFKLQITLSTKLKNLESHLTEIASPSDFHFTLNDMQNWFHSPFCFVWGSPALLLLFNEKNCCTQSSKDERRRRRGDDKKLYSNFLNN